jgi:hypothetical protein
VNVLLVTFELNPGRNLAQVQSCIEQYEAMRFSESSFAIRTNDSPQAVYATLERFLGKDDIVYVLGLSKPWYGYGYGAMNEWLNRHLG